MNSLSLKSMSFVSSGYGSHVQINESEVVLPEAPPLHLFAEKMNAVPPAFLRYVYVQIFVLKYKVLWRESCKCLCLRQSLQVSLQVPEEKQTF